MTSARLNHDCDTALELHQILTAAIARGFSMDEREASAMADAVAYEMRREVGGQEIYVPTASKAARDEQIRREFCGRNAEALARQHGLSRSSIYRIAGAG